MSYSTHFPAPPLDRFIDHFWLLQDYQSGAAREQIFPDGGLELMINLGEPQRLYDSNEPEKFELFRTSWISGQRTQSIVIGSTKTVNLVGIRFKPWGGYPFLHVPLAELTNQVIDADLVLGPVIGRIRDQLAETHSAQDLFDRLEQALRGRLDSERIPAKSVVAAADQLLNTHPALPIRQLAGQVGLSHKHLLRLFYRNVGLTPKNLHRIGRFQNALQQLEQPWPINLAHLAVQCGYSDQAHFANEFKQLTGTTPTQYLGKRGDYLNYITLEAW